MEGKIAIALRSDEIKDLIQRATVRITQQVADIDLQPDNFSTDLGSDLGTVYTTLNGPYHTRIMFCAPLNLFQRATEHMLGEPMASPDDLEECAIEYFNVLCGHIVAEIFRRTRTGARFHPPRFVYGHYEPELPGGNQNTLVCFTSSQQEHVIIVHSDTTSEKVC